MNTKKNKSYEAPRIEMVPIFFRAAIMAISGEHPGYDENEDPWE